MEHVKVGVAGVGAMGKKHCRVLSLLNHIDFVGVFDSSQERCGQIACEYQVIPFMSYSEMLTAVDAVIIAAPTLFHYKYTLEALQNGIHVFVEKPFVSSLTEAEALLDVYNHSHHIRIQIGHIERFNPSIQQLNELIDPLKIVSLEASRICKSERNLDIDVVLDLMIHDIDIIINMVKSPLYSVVAAGLSKKTDGLDIVNAILTFDNGTIANLTANRVSARSNRSLSVTENDRVYYIDYNSKELKIYREPNSLFYPVDNSVEKVKVLPVDPLQAEVEHFIDSIRMQCPPVIGPYEATKALSVAMKIKESIQEKQIMYFKRGLSQKSILDF